MLSEYLPELIATGLSLLYLVGIIAAIDALLTARTPQGAIAWSLFLVMFPVLGLPFDHLHQGGIMKNHVWRHIIQIGELLAAGAQGIPQAAVFGF